MSDDPIPDWRPGGSASELLTVRDLPGRAVAAHVSVSLPAEAASLVAAYQRASKADSTVKAYLGDAEVFQA